MVERRRVKPLRCSEPVQNVSRHGLRHDSKRGKRALTLRTRQFQDARQPVLLLFRREHLPGFITRQTDLATHQEISKFLADVERRAFKQAVYAVRDDEVALDVVQDAMLKLTEKYRARPIQELPLLFQRILQNTIRDHFRRQKVRNLWTTLASALTPSHENDDHDLMETLEVKGEPNYDRTPPGELERVQVLAIIEEALQKLPVRQRQAFLLRYWEEMDVAETAAVMGCSGGSVKTHCFRAVCALAQLLKAKGVTL